MADFFVYLQFNFQKYEFVIMNYSEKGKETGILLRKLAMILILTALILPVTLAQGGKRGAPPLRERIFFGGSASVTVGSVTNIEISPLIGLRVLPPLSIAAGPTYIYYSDPYGKTNILGGRTYLQMMVIRDLNNLIPLGIHMGIFFHAEDEFLSLDSEYWKNITTEPDRFMVNTALIGGGIAQPMGGRASFQIMVLWALTNSEFGLYSNPEIRIGFVF